MAETLFDLSKENLVIDLYNKFNLILFQLLITLTLCCFE